jgi:hypothetical protein
MAPKIEAMIACLDRPGRRRLISDPASIGRAVGGQAGALIVPD